MKLVAISDTHGHHKDLCIPDGDILIHAGDFTETGSFEEVEAFNDFLGTLPHQHKILIAGNHDFCLEREPEIAEPLVTNAHYLRDESITINGIKFYGSPWQPWFYGWAFNLPRGEAIQNKWDLIDQDTDILITHGPPLGHGDTVLSGEQVGCKNLLNTVQKIKPMLHIFGHIHESPGISMDETTTFINASSCNIHLEIIHPPISMDI